MSAPASVPASACDQNCARCLRILLRAEPCALPRDVAATTGYAPEDVVCPGCLRVLYRERDERVLDREVGL